MGYQTLLSEPVTICIITNHFCSMFHKRLGYCCIGKETDCYLIEKDGYKRIGGNK